MVAEDVPPGADCTVPWGAPEPLGAVALAGGAVVSELGYSSAPLDGALDGELSDPVGAALEAGGASADDGEALGPGTSTCTFGGAPFGCGITMIGPTRTGPTCTGPTVTGGGRASDEGRAPGDVGAGSVLGAGRDDSVCVVGEAGAACALVFAVAAGGGLIGITEVSEGRADDGTTLGRAVGSAFGAVCRDRGVADGSEVSAADGSSPVAGASVLLDSVLRVGSADDGTDGSAGEGAGTAG